MSGLDLRYDLGDRGPLVGSRMVDLALETESGLTTVSTLLRSGRGLFLELGGALPYPTPVTDGVDRIIARVIDSPVGTALGDPISGRVRRGPVPYPASSKPPRSTPTPARSILAPAAVPLIPGPGGGAGDTRAGPDDHNDMC